MLNWLFIILKMAFIIKLCLVFLMIVPCRNDCMRKSGPYEAEQESYEDCIGTRDHEIMVSAKVNRDPTNCNVRNICIDLNIFLKYDLNNDYEIKRTLYCKDSIGLWKFFRDEARMNACDKPNFWMLEIQTLTNAASPCPVPKGNYSIECHKINHTHRDTELHFYGQYKVIKQYFRNGTLVGCTERKERVYPIEN